jgi:macrolide transport system ATP-binding/permease protein
MRPLIRLDHVGKSLTHQGGIENKILNDVSICIHAGDFVAILGASGSGKTTLMNILGCLDRATTGTYYFADLDTAVLDEDDLAYLRGSVFGFVFQQYNLIGAMSAIENIEVPAVYAGYAPAQRRSQARKMLAQFGLGGLADRRPHQLSGGEQQRVAIGRALVNGAQVILADEPTGALDRRAGDEVAGLLNELWKEGRTIILVTHDAHVAEAAQRVVEIADGRIVRDVRRGSLRDLALVPVHDQGQASIAADIREALRAASNALAVNPVRTGLTLLGIVIGVAAMITLVALGQGAKRNLEAEFANFGANQIFVSSSNTSREPRERLSLEDASAIGRLPNVGAAMPYLDGTVTARFADRDATIYAAAVTSEFPAIYNWKVRHGAFFGDEDDRSGAPVVILGADTARFFFSDGQEALGRFLLVNNTPLQIIGVLEAKGAGTNGESPDNRILFPFSSGAQRVFGSITPSLIAVLASDRTKVDSVADAITSSLTENHPSQQFNVYNRSAAVESERKSQDTLTLLLGSTAAISLLVGGIGIMNVMLMAIGERTREIGIRLAVGARAHDIRRQFLNEAAILSGAGGITGIAVGVLLGLCLSFFGVSVIFTVPSMLFALASSIILGMLFGYFPARRAAAMVPRAALAR